jgi:hypothetical protein
MAVSNRNSSAIANLVATPRVINKPALAGGAIRGFPGLVTPAADDEATSIFRFCRVPSNLCVHSVLYSGADATTAGAIDLGIYQTADNGGAVVDADLFASAFALTAGPDHNTELAFESGQYTLAESVTPLWQVLGLSSDPCIEYDVAATITTTFNGGPTAMKLLVLGVV